jgi:hypothetical protein
MPRRVPEQAGFEPAEPCGSTVFKTVARKSQSVSNKGLSDTPQGDSGQILPDASGLESLAAAWPTLPINIQKAILLIAGITVK